MHLSDEELKGLKSRGAAYGKSCAYTAAIPVAVAFVVPHPIVYVVAGLLVAVHFARIPSWLRSQKAFLCSTTWARQRGYARIVSGSLPSEADDDRYRSHTRLQAADGLTAGFAALCRRA